MIHGIAGVFWTPAEILMIHDIVGGDDLPSAVRLNATARQLGILFGPAVGGAMMLWFGAPAGLLINAVIYLPLTIWLMLVPYTGHLREGAPARRGLRWRDAANVLREVAQHRSIVTMIVLGGAASLFVGNAFQASMPEFAHDLGTEKADFAYSALLAANAAGSVFGGFVLDGKAMGAADGESCDQLCDSLVPGDDGVRFFQELSLVLDVVVCRRRPESRVLLDRPDHRATGSADPFARPVDWPILDVGLRSARL